ncbi:unnamed protein product [Protopolystoma xenopodis]|uniref:Uncharacterized protein n=1 Tax=Protopolystoma xenopodis TaxID=117903 RepID=A0A3S5A9H4_9PLAT|nr:unnamed protein product [Protopolystoma xenopodis]
MKLGDQPTGLSAFCFCLARGMAIPSSSSPCLSRPAFPFPSAHLNLLIGRHRDPASLPLDGVMRSEENPYFPCTQAIQIFCLGCLISSSNLGNFVNHSLVYLQPSRPGSAKESGGLSAATVASPPAGNSSSYAGSGSSINLGQQPPTPTSTPGLIISSSPTPVSTVTSLSASSLPGNIAASTAAVTTSSSSGMTAVSLPQPHSQQPTPLYSGGVSTGGSYGRVSSGGGAPRHSSGSVSTMMTGNRYSGQPTPAYNSGPMGYYGPQTGPPIGPPPSSSTSTQPQGSLLHHPHHTASITGGGKPSGMMMVSPGTDSGGAGPNCGAPTPTLRHPGLSQTTMPSGAFGVRSGSASVGSVSSSYQGIAGGLMPPPPPPTNGTGQSPQIQHPGYGPQGHPQSPYGMLPILSQQQQSALNQTPDGVVIQANQQQQQHCGMLLFVLI